jgi:hypothetical protein
MHELLYFYAFAAAAFDARWLPQTRGVELVAGMGEFLFAPLAAAAFRGASPVSAVPATVRRLGHA